MFEIFSRSWKITKLSFKVISHDKEMLMFPVLSGVFSVLFFIAMLFPSVISKLIEDSAVNDGVSYLLVFVTYLGLAFISTFFSVATVYTVKTRFEGNNASFMDSIKFSFSKIHLILGWSAVSATVGLILNILDSIADKASGPVKFILNGIRFVAGMAWVIVSVFVVPAMVYDNVGPFKALKISTGAIKKTWGESLVRVYGLGFIQGLMIVLGILVFGALGYLLRAADVMILIGLGVIGVVYLIMVILVFNVANTVYNTALFVYANTGKIPEGFDSEVISHAFEKNKIR